MSQGNTTPGSNPQQKDQDKQGQGSLKEQNEKGSGTGERKA
jgi:hypothetical protein